MIKTGKMLREGRVGKNLTISEVALATKINPRVLQAMEAGELDKLPAISFLRGFIRSYAAHLKLDGDRLLAIFNEEITATRDSNGKQASESSIPQENNEEKSKVSNEGGSEKDLSENSSATWYRHVPILKDSSVRLKSLTAAGIVLLIALIIGVKGLVKKYEKEGSIPEAPENLVGLNHDADTPSGASDQLKVQKTQEKPPGRTIEERKETSNDGAETALEKKPSPKEISPESDSHQVITKEPALPSDVKSETALINQPIKDSTEGGAAGEESPQEIILEALDKVEVSFRIDGGQLKKIVLQPEQIHTIKGSRSVAIDLADGGAVNIIHNGIDEGVPGDLGKPKKVKYP